MQRCKIGRNHRACRSVAGGARRIARPVPERPPPRYGTGPSVGKRRQSQHNTAHHHPPPQPRSGLQNVPRSPELSCCDRKSAVLRSPRPIAPVSYLGAVFSMSSRPSPPRTSIARRTAAAPRRAWVTAAGQSWHQGNPVWMRGCAHPVSRGRVSVIPCGRPATGPVGCGSCPSRRPDFRIGLGELVLASPTFSSSFSPSVRADSAVDTLR